MPLTERERARRSRLRRHWQSASRLASLASPTAAQRTFGRLRLPPVVLGTTSGAEVHVSVLRATDGPPAGVSVAAIIAQAWVKIPSSGAETSCKTKSTTSRFPQPQEHPQNAVYAHRNYPTPQKPPVSNRTAARRPLWAATARAGRRPPQATAGDRRRPQATTVDRRRPRATAGDRRRPSTSAAKR